MANGIDIEVHYKKGVEDDKVEKVRAGLGMIADALGLGDVREQNFEYENGDSIRRFTAG